MGDRRLHNYDEDKEKAGGRRYRHVSSLVRTLSVIRPGLRKQRNDLKLLALLCHAFPLPHMTLCLSAVVSQHLNIFPVWGTIPTLCRGPCFSLQKLKWDRQALS